MAHEHVRIQQDGEVGILQLSRPPANAIELGLAREMEAAFDAALRAGPRALVLTGTERFFSGGLDLKAVPAYSRAQQRELLGVLNRMIGKLYACPVPLVGGVNGHAIAGGFILVLTTDFRVGPQGDALFGLTEARAGIPFPAGPMVVLQAELSPADVRYTTLLARNFGPEEARERGVLDELQPPAAVLPRAIEVARDLAGIPPDAYRRIKQQVRGAAIARIEEVVEAGADPMLESWISPDAQDASAALLARKRDG